MSCSFLDIAGRVCGAKERARHLSTQTVSLSSCSKDIRSHKSFLQFLGAETEIELTLARSGIFVKPVNFSELTVCQNYFHVSRVFRIFANIFTSESCSNTSFN